MKTNLINTMLFTLLSLGGVFAQNVTTVRATNSDISDNLDLQAVASIFGDSQDLEDFEHRLNDPDTMISNLDLNNDGRVDYLRVVELAEQSTHVIVLQSVLGPDTFQDVATIEVERDRYNNVTVQVVGDPYIYGPSYIYEPVYVTRPVVFGLFWVSSYRPYYSPWYWGYYPTYYNYWAPCAPYRYHNHVNVYINYRNTYNYVNIRHSNRAANLYNPRRANAYERENPGRSFAVRNNNVRNHFELQQTRGNVTPGTRSGNTRGYNSGTRSTLDSGNGRNYSGGPGRENGIRSLNQGTGGRSFNSASQGTRDNAFTPSRGNSSNTPGRSNSNFNNDAINYTPSRSYTTPRQNNTVRTDGFTPSVRQNQGPSRGLDNNSPVRQNSSPRNFNNSSSIRGNSGNGMQAPPQVRSLPSAPSRQNSAPVNVSPRVNGNNGGAGAGMRNGRN